MEILSGCLESKDCSPATIRNNTSDSGTDFHSHHLVGSQHVILNTGSGAVQPPFEDGCVLFLIGSVQKYLTLNSLPLLTKCGKPFDHFSL